MADVFSMMDIPEMVAPSTTKVQPLEQARDVSGYDRIDLAIDTPGVAPTSVRILTSMTLQPDDALWVEAAATSSAPSNNSANAFLTVPASGKPLFRYIRWEMTAGANTVTARITGMARRA